MVRVGAAGFSMTADAVVAPSISGPSAVVRSATSVMDLLLVAGPARRRCRCSVEAPGAGDIWRPGPLSGPANPGATTEDRRRETRGPAGLTYEEGSEPESGSLPRCLSDAGRGARSTTGIG